MLLGASHFSTSSTFFFCISISFGPITIPRNFTSLIFYLHFFGFTNRSFSFSLFSTSSTNSLCPSFVSVATSMLSMNIAVFLWFIISWNKLFIIIWKVVGELVKPKYIIVGLYAPICVMNVMIGIKRFDQKQRCKWAQSGKISKLLHNYALTSRH